MHCGRKVDHLVGRVGLVDQGSLVGCLGAQPRPRTDAADLTFDQAFRSGRVPSANTWNLRLDEPALTTRTESMTAQTSGTLASLRRASA